MRGYRFSGETMTCPARLVLVAALGVRAIAAGFAQTEGAAAVQPVAVPSQGTSKLMRARITEVALRYEAALPKAAPAAALAPSGESQAPADPSVVTMPNYVVQESKLPKASEVMSDRAVAEFAMNRYLGSKDGLDRGFLNRVTIPELWKKIPIIGKILPPLIPSVTNEQRAMMYYYQDMRVQQMNDLLDLARMTRASGNTELSDKIRRETHSTFK